MNLKEQIDNTLWVNSNREAVSELEKLIDKHAIGFADWLNVNAYKFPNKTTTKELLEIYKKTL